MNIKVSLRYQSTQILSTSRKVKQNLYSGKATVKSVPPLLVCYAFHLEKGYRWDVSLMVQKDRQKCDTTLKHVQVFYLQGFLLDLQ